MSYGVVSLLPVRNGAADLPFHFEAVAALVDEVVALDDGSTDATRDVLREHPIVEILLAHPVRRSYVRWDDSLNRNELLAAAERLNPRWIVSLDADEVIDIEDAIALREFLLNEADPRCAYGFRMFRMIGGMNNYDKASLWVYRLFGFRKGQRFPNRKLHFEPIPTEIPRRRWLKTNVRIKHRASLDEGRRRARYQKYIEADPFNRYQSDYSNLLDQPGTLREWAPRAAGSPILLRDG